MNRDDIIIDVYEFLCSYENLKLAFDKAKKGKTQKKYVIEFAKELKKNLLELKIELLMQTYKPRALKTFILRDPKTRKISKSAFRDRVVHHAICNIIEPIFDKRFIDDSYANRIRKGTFKAIKRFNQFKRKVSQNNTIRCYVLKADIKHYFESVDHKILLEILKKRIKDKRLIWLIKTILSNHKSEISSRGIPLGNLTSQFFANVYLNELDQFIKHKLRARYYIRYVDDFVVLHCSRNQLEEYKDRINKFLNLNLHLELHPEKSKILKLEKGIGFLGFRIFYYHRLLRRKNIKKFEKRLQNMITLYKKEKISRENVIEKFEGWLAYVSHADSYKYRKKITKTFNHNFPVQPENKIGSVKKHENFSKKIDASKTEFSQEKTLLLFKKGFNVKQIAKKRNLKESTIWGHISMLIGYHRIKLNEILSNQKIKTILLNIKNSEDKLKDIKARIKNEEISYDDINCVLANLKGKHKKKSICYFINWYQRTNCFRKCYYNKAQRKKCRIKFQKLLINNVNLQLTKKGFLNFINNHANVCILPDKEKKKFISWKKFKLMKKQNKY